MAPSDDEVPLLLQTWELLLVGVLDEPLQTRIVPKALELVRAQLEMERDPQQTSFLLLALMDDFQIQSQ